MKPDSSLGIFIILLSILGGLLLAGPLADTSGLITDMRHREVIVLLRIGCGVLAAFLLIHGFRALLQISLGIIETLRRTSSRPNCRLAKTLILGGTLCLLATLGLECLVVYRCDVLGMAPTVHLQGPGGDVSWNAGMGRPALMMLISQAFAGLGFLAGCTMIGIGVWGSIPAQVSAQMNVAVSKWSFSNR